MSHNQNPTEALMKNLPEKSTHDRQEEEEDVNKRSKTTHESEPAIAKDKAEPKLVLSYTPPVGWGIRFKRPQPFGDRDTSFSISSLYANVDNETVEQSVNADEMDPEVKLVDVNVVIDVDDVEKKDVQMPVDDVKEGVDVS